MINLMNVSKMAGRLMFLSTLFCQVSYSQDSVFKSISLNSLDAFRDPGKNWVIGSDASADYSKPQDINVVKGQGVLINDFSKNKQMNLFTKEEFGDVEVEMDFMMAKNSNAGVYLEGRYELQLLDSWTRLDPTYSDLGGIYARWTPDRGVFEGTPPDMNVAKAPGLWQHLKIKFRAPRFNEKGEKITNARFEEVYINGVLVQQESEVTGPTGSGMYRDEKPVGPLAFQGDHGPVAFKNIRYRGLYVPAPGPERDEYWIPKSNYWNTVNKIIVNPCDNKPSFIKTFLMHGDKKLTHVLSVGYPSELNYSYDVKEGALFQVWRGKFMDLTPAWQDRGGMQLGVPLGSVISLSDAPVVATLQNENVAWPDSVAFDDFHNKGYVLDKQRSPTFSYEVNGWNIEDSILSLPDGEGLVRTITVRNADPDLYTRIASGESVEKISRDLYAIDGKSYYIKIDRKFKPVIRSVAKGQEIIVKYANAGPVTYSMIW